MQSSSYANRTSRATPQPAWKLRPIANVVQLLHFGAVWKTFPDSGQAMTWLLASTSPEGRLL